MQENAFNALLTIKIRNLISLMKGHNTSFKTALKTLYTSKTFQQLKTEELKVWHYSTSHLYELIKEEKNDNDK